MTRGEKESTYQNEAQTPKRQKGNFSIKRGKEKVKTTAPNKGKKKETVLRPDLRDGKCAKRYTPEKKRGDRNDKEKKKGNQRSPPHLDVNDQRERGGLSKVRKETSGEGPDNISPTTQRN